jgi:hypothetical protein
MRPHKKTEHLIEQFKQTIGTNIHMITKHDLRKLKINRDEVFNQSSLSIYHIKFFVSDRFLSMVIQYMEYCLSGIIRRSN